MYFSVYLRSLLFPNCQLAMFCFLVCFLLFSRFYLCNLIWPNVIDIHHAKFLDTRAIESSFSELKLKGGEENGKESN